MGDAGLTSPATRERLKVLVQPHVASFDYFATRGLAAVTRSLEPATVDDGAGPQLSLWLEDVHLRKPLVEERGSAAGRQDLRVLPRECREAGSTYSGSMRAKVCWRVGASGEVMHKDVRLGAFPIMARAGATPPERPRRAPAANLALASGWARLLRHFPPPSPTPTLARRVRRRRRHAVGRRQYARRRANNAALGGRVAHEPERYLCKGDPRHDQVAGRAGSGDRALGVREVQ